MTDPFALLDADRRRTPPKALAESLQRSLMADPAFSNRHDPAHAAVSAEVRRLACVIAGEGIPDDVQAAARGDRDPLDQPYRDYVAANWQAFTQVSHPDHSTVSATAARMVRQSAEPDSQEPI